MNIPEKKEKVPESLLKIKNIVLVLISLTFIVTIAYFVFLSAFREYEEVSDVKQTDIYNTKDTYQFKSLRANKVNVRRGPSLNHDILWTYKKKGIPIEILEDVQGWSKVRDFEADVGWIKNTLLSKKRTGMIEPWNILESNNSYVELYFTNDMKRLKMKLQAGLLVNIQECNGSICHIEIDKQLGWAIQENIFGVYPGETISLDSK